MRLVSSILLTSVLIAMTGCSPSKGEREILDEAKAAIAQSNNKVAEINLKQYLSNHADSGAARALLGVSLNLQGKYAESEFQFMKVKSFSYPSVELESRIESLYNLSELETLIRVYEATVDFPSLPILNSDIAYVLAKLRIQNDEQPLHKLKDLIVEFDELNSGFLKLLLDFYKTKDSEEFLLGIQALESSFPAESNNNWFFLEHIASFNLSSGNNADAIEKFKRLVELRPFAGRAALGLANAYVQAENWQLAEQELNRILKRYPEQPKAHQLMTYVKINESNLREASFHIQTALSNGYTSRGNYLLSGVISFDLGNYEQAIAHLERGLQGAIKQTKYHQMLVYARAVTAKDDSLLDQLDEKEIKDNSDIYELSALLEGYESMGNTLALQNFAGGINLSDSATPAVELEYNVMNYSNAPEESAENIIKASKRLISSYLRGERNFNREQLTVAKSSVLGQLVEEGNYQKAIDLINQWIEIVPEDQTNRMFLADVFNQAGHYQKTIDLFSDYPESLNNEHTYTLLTDAYVNIGQSLKAFETIQTGLSKFEYNVSLIRVYSALVISKKLPGDKFISELYDDYMQNISAAILLNIYYASTGQLDKAISTLTSYKGSNKETMMYWYTLSQSYILGDKFEEAKQAIVNVKGLTIVSLRELEYALTTFAQLEDAVSQIELLEQYIPQFPGNDTLKARLAKLYVEGREYTKALSILDSVSQQNIDTQLLKAEATYRSGKLNEATIIYEKALTDFPVELVLLNYAQFVQNTQGNKPAIKIIERYVEDFESTINIKLLLATMETGEEAISLYLEVLEAEPKNIIALNNAADELNKLGRPSEALPYAQRALELAPDNQVIQTTVIEIKGNL